MHRGAMPTAALMEELQAAAPEVYEIMAERLNKKKLPSFERLRQGWPEARKRTLEEGRDALLHDLYTPSDYAH